MCIRDRLQAIGDVQQFRKELDAALESYAAALRLFREIGDRLGEANVLQAIGDVQQFRDDRDAALESYAAALRLFREIGAKLGEANVQLSWGKQELFQEDVSKFKHGAQLLQSALSIYREIGALSGQANALMTWAQWLATRGQIEQALPFAQEAYDLGNAFAPGHPVTEWMRQFIAALQEALAQQTASEDTP